MLIFVTNWSVADIICLVTNVRIPLGSGSAGLVTNSQPASSRSSISKQSAVSTRAPLSEEALRDTEAAASGTGTVMSRSPPGVVVKRSRAAAPAPGACAWDEL